MKTFILALLTLTSCFTAAAALTENVQALQSHSSQQVDTSQTKPSHNNHHSYMGSHGMAIIFGENKTLIAHHLPLFYFPHDYQVVYKIKIDSNSALEKLLALSTKPLVTIVPDNFDLLKLINKTRFSLKAKVYDGHFERGGTSLFDVDVLFDKALYVEPIVVNENPTNLDMTFDFIKIKDNKKLLAIKKINEKPSFDALTWIAKSRVKKAKSITCSSVEAGSALKARVIRHEIAACLGNKPIYLETADFK